MGASSCLNTGTTHLYGWAIFKAHPDHRHDYLRAQSMAWNQPGGGGDKDPWGNKGGGDGGPPDLDEVLRKLKDKLKNAFGGGSRKPLRSVTGGDGGGDSGGDGGSGDGIPEKVAWGALALLVLGWLASGFYIVDPPERGVVTRFGAYHATTGPGPHWHVPWPVHDVEIVNVERSRTQSIPPQLILTRDENLSRIQLEVQYNIGNARDYLFNVDGPDQTLRDSLESVIREVIGKQALDFVITEGRSEISDMTEQQTQQILDDYTAGIDLQTVNLQEAQPPEPVQPAFEDAIMAREDRERLINEAQAVENELIPNARGNAERIREEAEAYRVQTVQAAIGESARFTSVLEAYEKNPDVTRRRLHIDAMENVFGETAKVMISGDGEGSKLMYLPLEGMIGNAGRSNLEFEDRFGVKVPRGVTGSASERGDSGNSLRGDRSRSTRSAN